MKFSTLASTSVWTKSVAISLLAIGLGCRASDPVRHRPTIAVRTVEPIEESSEPDSAPVQTVGFQEETRDQNSVQESDPKTEQEKPNATKPQDDGKSKQERPELEGADKPLFPRLIRSKEEGQDDSSKTSLVSVATSVHKTYPLLDLAYQQNQIAAGKQLASVGGFDTALKASTENVALGFYENYRNKTGFSQPLYHGGEVFAGYRSGRGDFEPWYQERETNEGGEFRFGTRIPLLRDRDIDSRRAKLWQAEYDQQRAVPEIRSQLIVFVRDASVAYWSWVAAGQKYEIGKAALDLAKTRNDQLKRRVDLGAVDPPVLQDNLRSIARREAKLLELKRKLAQAAIKLSLFYRTEDGQPIVLKVDQLVGFPQPKPVDKKSEERDIRTALSNRPELEVLNAIQGRVQVELEAARNRGLPAIDARVTGSQDVGGATSAKRDKSQFELEAGIFFDFKLQRREAIGRSQIANAKLIQISAKRQFAQDKISAEVSAAYAIVLAAYERVAKAREARRLAEYMANIERRKLELGGSDLFAVVFREQQAIEASEEVADALLEYFIGKARLNAAIANEWPESTE